MIENVGYVNRKNFVVWETLAPDEVLQRPLHSAEFTAWITILKHGIIRSFLFENDVEETGPMKNVTLLFLTNSGRHFVPVVRCMERSNGFNQTVKLPKQLTSLFSAAPRTCIVRFYFFDKRY